RELTRYGVKSRDLKLPGGAVAKGYRTDGHTGLHDAWSRYLPAPPTTATSATTATSQVNPVAATTATPPQGPHHRDTAEVADPSATPDPSATR
ncbi:MAG: DUF3631 domain-containing protein, partial [Gemmatimonadota bacterium]|nr:DUF3631 domain-containing protein [Gemmatimonadota bacterium]